MSVEIAPFHHHELPDLPPIFEEVVLLIFGVGNVAAQVGRIVMAAVIPTKSSIFKLLLVSYILNMHKIIQLIAERNLGTITSKYEIG